MKVREWPNNLGWDVGSSEVWKLFDGSFGVRTFRDGIAWRCCQYPGGCSLIAIVKDCRKYGERIA